jgi:hypothetical protein
VTVAGHGIAAVSRRAEAAERAAAGSPADAVVWEEMEARTSESAVLSGNLVAIVVAALATLVTQRLLFARRARAISYMRR